MTREETKERDQLFCELLFELGSVKAASEQMEITVRTGRKIAERNKDLILEMTNTELSSLAFGAVNAFREGLQEDGSTPKGEVRIKTASEILDRIGAAKKITSEVEIKADTPVILMPAKDPIVKPTISISTDQENQ